MYIYIYILLLSLFSVYIYIYMCVCVCVSIWRRNAQRMRPSKKGHVGGETDRASWKVKRSALGRRIKEAETFVVPELAPRQIWTPKHAGFMDKILQVGGLLQLFVLGFHAS